MAIDFTTTRIEIPLGQINSEKAFSSYEFILSGDSKAHIRVLNCMYSGKMASFIYLHEKELNQLKEIISNAEQVIEKFKNEKKLLEF